MGNCCKCSRFLRCYRLFKDENYVEQYTIHLKRYSLRRLVAALRCGALDIKVNSGRRSKIPYNQRLCTFCSLGVIENEFHFTLVCPSLQDIRLKYISPFYVEQPDINKFNSLVTSSSNKICKNLALFIHHAFKLRYKNN